MAQFAPVIVVRALVREEVLKTRTPGNAGAEEEDIAHVLAGNRSLCQNAVA